MDNVAPCAGEKRECSRCDGTSGDRQPALRQASARARRNATFGESRAAGLGAQVASGRPAAIELGAADHRRRADVDAAVARLLLRAGEGDDHGDADDRQQPEHRPDQPLLAPAEPRSFRGLLPSDLAGKDGAWRSLGAAASRRQRGAARQHDHRAARGVQPTACDPPSAIFPVGAVALGADHDQVGVARAVQDVGAQRAGASACAVCWAAPLESDRHRDRLDRRPPGSAAPPRRRRSPPGRPRAGPAPSHRARPAPAGCGSPTRTG